MCQGTSGTRTLELRSIEWGAAVCTLATAQNEQSVLELVLSRGQPRSCRMIFMEKILRLDPQFEEEMALQKITFDGGKSIWINC